MLRIAIDYDDTYTADPALWDRFIADAKQAGHIVYLVTARIGTMENREDVVIPGISSGFRYFTSLAAKRWYMQEQGIKIDIWIDDSPEYIIHPR